MRFNLFLLTNQKRGHGETDIETKLSLVSVCPKVQSTNSFNSFTFFLLATNSRCDAGLIGNDIRQKAVLSGWAKKYVVVEIPPYCRQRGGQDDGETEGRKEGNDEDMFGESWSPMVPSSERDSGEAMDCSSSLEEEEARDRGTHMCSV